MSTNPNSGLDLRRFRIIGSAVLGFASLAGFATTLGMDGSLHYPLAYSQTLIVLIGLLFFAASVLAQREPSVRHLAVGAPPDAAGGRGALACMIALCLIYVLSWDVVGYFLSTFVFAALQLWVMRQRRWQILLGVPAAVTLVVYIVFYRLLQLPFPTGSMFG